MERNVIYRDRQELQSADLNNMQDFARTSMDHIVRDAVESGKAYSGFSATKTAATEITLSAGRLYAGGAVYARGEDIIVDLFNVLPLVTRKRVAIVSFGQEVETDIQPRDFLIDAQTGTTEPQSVAMESLRRAEISTVAGTEGPDPSYPATDANVTVIAYVLLDTTGVVAIEQWQATQLPNLRNVANRTIALERWRGQITGAGLGQRLARTIRSEQYPKGQPSLNAAALVWSKAPDIVSAHDTGPMIRSRNGFWLTIPTAAAGKSRRGGRISPVEWERRTGLRLRFVYRRSGPRWSGCRPPQTASQCAKVVVFKATQKRGRRDEGYDDRG